MKLDLYIASKSALPYRELFNPHNGAVEISSDGTRFTIKAWDAARVGFPQPSETEIARILQLPELVQPELVKKECGRRIVAIASQNAQINMAAYMASGHATDDDKTGFAEWLSWVQSMRSRSSSLIDANDSTYNLDASWPTITGTAKAFAANF